MSCSPPTDSSSSSMVPSNERNEAMISLFVTSSAFVKWSTPERRNDTRYLPLIPSEIYLMIFEELLRSLKPCNPTKYERTMASLSLVCSFFRAVCQSQIFQKLSFTGAGRTRKTQDHHRNWRMSLAAHDARCIALSSHVKSCKYDDWVSESHENQISMAVLVQNLQSASFLLSLTSVELYSCPIPPSALFALANIPTLIAVNMHWCETRPDRSNTLSDIPERGWTSLRIFRCYDMGEHFASTLMKLIDYAKLKSLVVPDFTTAEFVEALIPPDVTSNGHLETLDVMLPENTSVFLNYLKRARNLQYLFVRDRDTDLEDESEITLSCRVELSNAVAGRLFSCKINLLTCSTEMDISLFRIILGAWNPPLKLTKLKFSMLVNSQDPFNNAEDLDLSRAVLPPMLDLFARMKTNSEPAEAQIFSSAETFTIHFGIKKYGIDPSGWFWDWEQLSRSMREPDLSELLDDAVNDTFPNLTSIEHDGAVKWRRRPGSEVWRSVEA